MCFSIPSTGIFALSLISKNGGVLAFEEGAVQELVAPASVSFNGHSTGSSLSNGGINGGGSGGSSSNINYNRPFFDDISPHNVTAFVDETAVLKCRVKNKGDRTVSPFLLHNTVMTGLRAKCMWMWVSLRVWFQVRTSKKGYLSGKGDKLQIWLFLCDSETSAL